jgi:hypothetical protein
LTLELSHATIDHVEETGASIIHFTADEQLVLLEILHACDCLAKPTKAAVRAEDAMALKELSGVHLQEAGDSPL